MKIDLQLFAVDTGETWLLNETLNITVGQEVNFVSDFVSNSQSFKQMKYVNAGSFTYRPTVDSVDGMVSVYEVEIIGMDDRWSNQAYRTVTFATAPSGDLLTWLQSNGTKQSTIHFKHYYKGDAIGTGAVKFRDYSQSAPLPQLATPTNVTADGTTVSWDEVENATSYDIYVDGALYENVKTATIYNLTFAVDNNVNYNILDENQQVLYTGSGTVETTWYTVESPTSTVYFKKTGGSRVFSDYQPTADDENCTKTVSSDYNTVTVIMTNTTAKVEIATMLS